MRELKPCPFCGGDPRTDVRVTQKCSGDGMDIIDFSVSCVSCGTNKTIRMKLGKTCEFIDVLDAMEKVEEVWNKRVNV